MLLCLTTMINVVILLLLVLFGNGIYTQQKSYYYYFISICSIKEVVDHVLNCHQIYPNAFNNHIDIILTWNRNHLLNTAKWSLFLVCHMMKLSLFLLSQCAIVFLMLVIFTNVLNGVVCISVYKLHLLSLCVFNNSYCYNYYLHNFACYVPVKYPLDLPINATTIDTVGKITIL